MTSKKVSLMDRLPPEILIDLARDASLGSVMPAGTPLPAVGAVVLDSSGARWQAGSIDTRDRIVGLCAERIALFYAVTNNAQNILQIGIFYDDNIGQISHPC